MGLALGLLAVMAGLLAASETAAQAVREGLALCGGSVIPALFPFLVVSRLFVATGSAAALGQLLAPLTRRMLGVSGPGGTAICWVCWEAIRWAPRRRESWSAPGSLPDRRDSGCCCSATTAARPLPWVWREWVASEVSGPGALLWLIHVSAAVLTALLTRQHLVPRGTDFAVCADVSGLRLSGAVRGAGRDAPRLRLRGVLSGADPAADGP